MYAEVPFSGAEIEKAKADVRQNIRDDIFTLAQAMSTLENPLTIENPVSVLAQQYVLRECPVTDFDYPAEFWQHTALLWADLGVKKCYERSNEYKLSDSAEYFLDKVEEVKQPDYLPSEQDILRCRDLTSGIFETQFKMYRVKFHLLDLSDHQKRRRIWIQSFDDVKAVIFVASCSSFNLLLGEDPSYNQLHESLELFRSIWNIPCLSSTSVILFLNKQDLLEEEVRSGKTKLDTDFPDFVHYIIPPEAQPEIGEGADKEYTRAKYFIRDKFLQISGSLSGGDGWQHRTHYCYPFFTCAVDTESMRRAFSDCRDTIGRIVSPCRLYDLL